MQIKQAESKNIELKVDFSSEIGPVIYHDKERIMQVLLNL